MHHADDSGNENEFQTCARAPQRKCNKYRIETWETRKKSKREKGSDRSVQMHLLRFDFGRHACSTAAPVSLLTDRTIKNHSRTKCQQFDRDSLVWQCCRPFKRTSASSICGWRCTCSSHIHMRFYVVKINIGERKHFVSVILTSICTTSLWRPTLTKKSELR